MAVRFPCPSCRGAMLLEPVHEGFEVPCPHCGRAFLVPPGAAATPAVAPGAAPETTPAGDTSVPPPRAPATEADGSLPLIFGILGLIGALAAPCTYGCLGPLALLSPVAWVLGHRGRAAARAQGRPAADSVNAGWVLGIIGTALIVLALCGLGVFVAIVAAN